MTTTVLGSIVWPDASVYVGIDAVWVVGVSTRVVLLVEAEYCPLRISLNVRRFTRTRAVPLLAYPNRRAAAKERSITRLFKKGPRSLTRTTMDLPFSKFVTKA